MNNDGETIYSVGHEIGTKAAERTEEQARAYCTCERQRIELANQPQILSLRAKIAVLKDTADDLESRIAKAAPPTEERARKRKVIFYWSIAALLAVTGFIFAVIAFEPFPLGWKSWLYCVGIAVVTPFLVDRMLESWGSKHLVKVIQTVACIAALVSVILLAVIRGDIFAEELTHESPVVSITTDDASATSAPPPPASTPAESFYTRTLCSLRLVMALLALAMELGAGLAVHEARRWSSTGENSATLGHELKVVQNEMIERGEALMFFETEGAVFEKSFWRDFYWSLLTKTVTGAMRKLAMIVIVFACLANSRLHAVDRLDVIVLPDLSQSVAAKDQSGKTEFQKNIEAVTGLLASLPAGSRVSVYGITDDSFGKPYPLLTAELSDNEGYFKERLSQGHRQLIRAWQERARTLQPQFSRTDILGAIFIASQVFAQKPPGRKKILVFFSDMRQSTRTLDLEHINPMRQQRGASLLEGRPMPDLSGVHIYALGVDANGVSLEYWRNLKNIWLTYFKRTGAAVEGYSVLRIIPEL